MSTEFFTVKEVQARTVTTKFGVKQAYDVFSTAGQKYGAGFKAPAVKPGDNVQAEVNVGKYGPDIQTIQVVTAGLASGGTGFGGMTSGGILSQGPVQFVPTPPSPRDPYAYANGSHAFPLPQTHGDRTFVRQHALERAVSVIGHEAEASAIIELARKFEAYIAGDEDLVNSKKFAEEAEQVTLKATGPAAAPAISVADAIKAARNAVKSRS